MIVAAMDEQLSLFLEENVLFNTGTRQLLDFDFTGCLETLQRYRRLYPRGKDAGREMAMAEFWIARLGEADWVCIDGAEAERRAGMWFVFEENFGYPWPEYSFEELFRQRYFWGLAKGLDESGHGAAPKLGKATCTGLVYLLAGRTDAAIASLQRLVALEPENSRAYGYLGDAYVAKKDFSTGRMCYQRAFALGPKDVDLKHLADTEVKSRLKDLAGDERVAGDPLGWFPVMAQLEGLFEPLVCTDAEDLRRWRRRYKGMWEMYQKNGDPALIPRLFYHAMVLSDNASLMPSVGEIDLLEVRKKMKEWRPDLFAAYMERLREREETPKGRLA